jgi:hypothetical protein
MLSGFCKAFRVCISRFAFLGKKGFLRAWTGCDLEEEEEMNFTLEMLAGDGAWRARLAHK